MYLSPSSKKQRRTSTLRERNSLQYKISVCTHSVMQHQCYVEQFSEYEIDLNYTTNETKTHLPKHALPICKKSVSELTKLLTEAERADLLKQTWKQNAWRVELGLYTKDQKKWFAEYYVCSKCILY